METHERTREIDMCAIIFDDAWNWIICEMRPLTTTAEQDRHSLPMTNMENLFDKSKWKQEIKESMKDKQKLKFVFSASTKTT